MPELPEVETVRAGLERWIVGRTIAAVDSLHPRAVRRHSPGAADLAERLIATTVVAVHRRGKYLWLSLDADTAGSDCLILHLGMSGQLLVSTPQAPDGPHLRGRIRFRDDGSQLRFVDQRTFGAMQLDALRTDGPSETPSSILHIGRDPLDPYFDDRDWIRRTRARRTTIKRALLDQSLMSGVGNIYADEALWRAKLHGDRPTASLSSTQLTTLLTDLRSVFGEALRAGGTSFDALYVDVNGQSGYFDRSLAVYGRAGEACRRCGKPISRAKWMNRSSYFCPGCQPRPRAVRKV